MNKILLTAISTIILGGIFAGHAQDGFVIHATKGGCDRELHYRKITDGTKVGEPKLVTKRGEGADIWPAISPDGEWLAWCRGDMSKKWNHKYGKCDYHDFGNWDIYIAKIDFGNTIPVKKVIKIANGYLPQWADDAKSPGKPKTLYFTDYSTQTIQKTIIQSDGSFSKPVEHSKCPKKVQGTGAHTQGSPDGKYILYRPNGIHLYDVQQDKDLGGTGDGCHPSWGPRSKYFIRSRNGAFFNTGSSVKSLGGAGVGAYFQGISNDAYWDEGKLWTIGKCGKYSDQNAEGSIEFNEVAIDGKGSWKLGKRTVVGKGCSPDIHFFDPGTGITTPKKKNISDNRLPFTAQIKTTASGLQLVINSQKLAGYTAGIYNIQGKLITSVKMSGSSQNIIPLKDITNGKYILKVSNNTVSTQKSIWISN